MANKSVTHTLTRDELYALVWQTPVATLAQQFGVSGRGLGKICRRLHVPVPPRGYWARKAAGQPITTIPLPAAPTGTRLQVTITHCEPTRPAPVQSEAEQRLSEAIRNASTIAVPKRLTSPHHIIGRWLNAHEFEIREARRLGWRLPRISELDRRRMIIFNVLFRELEKHGFEAKGELPRGVWLEIDGEKVELLCEEHVKQIRRPLTDEEKAAMLFYSGQKFRQEHIATGSLKFKIKTFIAYGVPVEWRDDTKSLEDCLGEIVAVLVQAAPILRKRRQRREEEESRRRQAEHRRYLDRQARELDEQRWQHLVEIAKSWEECELVRKFIDAVTRIPTERELTGDLNEQDWMAWVQKKLSSADPLTKGRNMIFRNIASIGHRHR